MRIILIDDDSAMHVVLRKLLGKIPGADVRAAFTDTESAASYLENHSADLAFVDISLPRETGLQFAGRMARVHPELHIVFVTSHTMHALDAFNLFAVDYIVKPVTQERLRMTMSRAFTLHRAKIETAIYGLGGLEARCDGLQAKWISRKSAELFACLLVHRGRKVSRSRLIDDIFGGMPQKNAEAYLNTTIYQLRKTLDPLGLKDRVRSDNEGYAFDAEGLWVDFIRFEEQVNSLLANGDKNLERGLETEAMYTGPLFGDKGFLWASGEAERLAQLHGRLIKRLAMIMLGESERQAEALRLLNKLLTAGMLEEETVRLAMEGYAAIKDKRSLIQLFDRYVRELRQELSIGPPKEMVVAYNRCVQAAEC